MDRKKQKLTPGRIMNNRYPQILDMITPPGMPRNYPYGPTPMPTSNQLYPSGVSFSPNMSASPYPSTAFTSGNPSNSSYPASSSPYLLAPNNLYPVSTSPYPASFNNPYPAYSSYPASCDSLYPASASPYLVSTTKCNSYPVFTSPYPASSNDIYPVSLSYYISSNIPYPASALPYLASSNNPYPASSNSLYSTSCNSPYPAPTSAYPYSSTSRYSTSCNSPYPAPTSAYPYSSNRHYPASNSSYPAPPSMNQPPGPSMRSRGYDSKFGPSIMNNRYPQTPGMIPPPGVPRDHPYGPTPMSTSNPLYSSDVGIASNMSASPYPSTAFTSGNPSNNSFPVSSSRYLLAPNNLYTISTSPYPASFNNPYTASSSYPASCDSLLYPASASPYLVSSTKCYPASGSRYPAPSNNRYPTSSNSPYPSPTSAYRCISDRHYPATSSSYSGPTSMNQPPGASPYPLMGPRDYDSKFGPSVNESNDDAMSINSLPDEIIEEVFSYLTQNQLGQIARVCRRWNMLTKSPVLWRKVNVKIFSFDGEENTVAKSFINGLPSCVTFIRLDFSGCEDLDFEELCMKLHHNCPHVEDLILVHCAISNILPEVINFCTKFLQCVKKLVLHHCHFPNCSRTVELNDNSKIEVLDLYGCYLFHFSKKQFSKLLYLKELRLADTNANDSWFVDNSSFLNQLHVLDLGWTSITANTFLLIQRHGHNLKELYLCNLILEDHDLDFNNSIFPHLRTICLSDTCVTCENVVSLILSCPSLESVYVYEHVAEYFAEHPFVVANRCKSVIVKAINWDHNHDVDYSHN